MNTLKNSFESRNIEFEYFESREELISALKLEFEKCDSIGVGNSKTLKELEVTKLVISMGKTVYDKTLADTKEEIRKLKKLALTSDCYISSCNAITKNGEIINVDHSGNRVAAITYGPDRVLLVVGENKITENEKEGIKRALNFATPMNANRAKISSACSLGKSCNECEQSVRVCNYISIIRGQVDKNRMKVFVINEQLGF